MDTRGQLSSFMPSLRHGIAQCFEPLPVVMERIEQLGRSAGSAETLLKTIRSSRVDTLDHACEQVVIEVRPQTTRMGVHSGLVPQVTEMHFDLLKVRQVMNQVVDLFSTWHIVILPRPSRRDMDLEFPRSLPVRDADHVCRESVFVRRKVLVVCQRKMGHRERQQFRRDLSTCKQETQRDRMTSSYVAGFSEVNQLWAAMLGDLDTFSVKNFRVDGSADLSRNAQEAGPARERVHGAAANVRTVDKRSVIID